jgi:hypothetical protein
VSDPARGLTILAGALLFLVGCCLFARQT